MTCPRPVCAHLLPRPAPPERLAGGVAVVVDVLRATTTVVHALAAGCVAVRPCAAAEEARALADALPAGKVLLGGERDGRPLPGFDLGNSPLEYTCARCAGATLVLTTTNGTRALLHAAAAGRVLAAAFVNFSAVCEQLRRAVGPVHVVCAGNAGEVALEDVLLAGALVDFLASAGPVALDDGARLAWAAFEAHAADLPAALAQGAGGAHLLALGYEDDLRAAARVDRFHLVPELRHGPLRLEVGAVGLTATHWPRPALVRRG